MKNPLNDWKTLMLLAFFLGFAPYFPEPHLFGKLRWVAGGAVGMQTMDPAFAEKLHGLLDTRVPAVDVAHVDQRAIFLDAREPEEYAVSHIKNARPVGYKDFDPSMIKDLPKDTAIIVYCSGSRAAKK